MSEPSMGATLSCSLIHCRGEHRAVGAASPSRRSRAGVRQLTMIPVNRSMLGRSPRQSWRHDGRPRFAGLPAWVMDFAELLSLHPGPNIE